MVRGFYWSSSDGQSKIHWRAWDICCKPKADGGLGFRNLQHFNTSLLAKQIWSLVQKPNSLVGSLLKAKYFQGTDIMQARLGSRPSYLWRSLLESRDLMAKGLRWRIGDGAGISIYRDPWLPMDSTFTPVHGSHSLPPQATVQKLIVPGQKKWNEAKIRASFLPHEADHILSIPLPSSSHQNKRIWHFHSKGVYTVKRGYHLAATLGATDSSTRSTPSSATASLWNFIWRLPVQPRIAHFIWRASHDCLPTAECLRRRTLSDGVCGLCGESREMLRHCLFDCQIPTGVRLADPQFDSWGKIPSTSFRDLMLTIIEREGLQEAGFCATLLWNIWKARCAEIFEGSPVYINQLCTHAQNQFDEYNVAISNAKSLEQPASFPDKWSSPPQGWVKCNVDGSLKDGKSAVGGILRDYNGAILLCYSEGLNVNAPHSSVSLVEAHAMKVGLMMAFNLGVSKLILESDSLALVSKVKSDEEDCSVLGTLLDDVRTLSSCFK